MAKETITDELNAMQNPPETPDRLMEIGAVNNATEQGAADTVTNTIDDTAKTNDGLRHDHYTPSDFKMLGFMVESHQF
ncbi:hypothetical protein E4U56_008332 [Claviceps arundinis]|uniref:Uncharacterized protein n=1 Tax=Claviceps arundinis TaxID=1623583 RepID=A0A9P7SR71_9HYPO|nr:hypothetical protein E4U56_008332 [Claviceps arundinis]